MNRAEFLLLTTSMARRALLFLCLFTASVFAVEEDCTLNSGGKYYDLNPLASKCAFVRPFFLNVVANWEV